MLVTISKLPLSIKFVIKTFPSSPMEFCLIHSRCPRRWPCSMVFSCFLGVRFLCHPPAPDTEEYEDTPTFPETDDIINTTYELNVNERQLDIRLLPFSLANQKQAILFRISSKFMKKLIYRFCTLHQKWNRRLRYWCREKYQQRVVVVSSPKWVVLRRS